MLHFCREMNRQGYSNLTSCEEWDLDGVEIDWHNGKKYKLSVNTLCKGRVFTNEEEIIDLLKNCEYHNPQDRRFIFYKNLTVAINMSDIQEKPGW